MPGSLVGGSADQVQVRQVSTAKQREACEDLSAMVLLVRNHVPDDFFNAYHLLRIPW